MQAVDTQRLLFVDPSSLLLLLVLFFAPEEFVVGGDRLGGRGEPASGFMSVSIAAQALWARMSAQ